MDHLTFEQGEGVNDLVVIEVTLSSTRSFFLRMSVCSPLLKC